MKNKFYTLWLTLIIILIFILQTAITGFTESFTLNQQSFSQPYRFVTSIFLHASLQHLIFNLFALLLFGLILEKLIESFRFLIVFFVSGIIANLIAVNFYNSSLGASGAIFGIIGALTLIKPLMTVWAFSLPMPLFVASIVWAIGDILGVFFPSGTGNIAHLSGLAIGIILGILFRNKSVPQYSYNIKIPESYMRSWESKFLKS